MGLFGKKEICSICNQNETSKKLLDGYICKECREKTFPFIITMSWKDYSVEKVKGAIAATTKNAELLKEYKPTKKIENYISFDEKRKLWRANSVAILFKNEDIISYELLEDGESITKGGLGRAAVGGALLGGTGAIVGGITGKKKTTREVNDLKIKIITRNEFHPAVYIYFLTTGPVKYGSILYNSYKGTAERILAELSVIVDTLNSEKDMTNTVSEADEILKFKKLCDEGIITQEEFEAKKKQLLGL